MGLTTQTMPSPAQVNEWWAGGKVRILVAHKDYEKGTEFRFDKAAPVGTKTYIIGKPLDGGPGGIFLPFPEVELVSETPKKVDAAPPEDSPFDIPGLADSPLLDVFRGFAPNTQESGDFFTLYQSEIGDQHTEILDSLLGQVGITMGDNWTNDQVKEMYTLLVANLAGAQAMPETAEPPIHVDAEVQRADDPVEKQPESVLDMLSPPAEKRGRGRPAGVPNKKKAAEQVTVFPEGPPAHQPQGQATDFSEFTHWSWEWKQAIPLAQAMLPVYLDYPATFDNMVEIAKQIVKKGMAK